MAQSESAIHGIVLSSSIIPAITFFIGVIALYFYPITKKYNEKMQAEIERVEQTDRLKTGALICAAAKLGCIAAGADEERILLAESYAQKVGLAFQITDDILDCTGDEKTLGKPTGSDEQNHKTTYVSVYGVEQARQVAQQLLEQAKCDLDSMKLEEQANFLYDLADYVLERRH